MKKALDLISFYNDMDLIVKHQPVDGRQFCLYIHLYVEHYVTLISQKKGIRGKNLRAQSLKLLENGTISPKAFNLILLIIKLRNKLVHSLTITLDEVNKKLDKMECLFHTNNPDLLHVIDAADQWQKLHIYSVSLITVLYKITCEIYKIKPKYDIRPEVFIHKDKKPTWKMVLLKKVS